MSEKEAVEIRAIIDSSKMTSHYSEIIWNIVLENSTDYFNGLRNLDDTARIIQNRVQTYLNEQQ